MLHSLLDFSIPQQITRGRLVGPVYGSFELFATSKCCSSVLGWCVYEFSCFEKYEKYLAHEEVDKKLINLGSCGPHVLNGAFQTGHQASEWQNNTLLWALCHVFKDVPARRAQFIEATGQSVFPSKFCKIRWTQNASAGKRSLDAYDDVIVFIKTVKLPKLTGVDTIKAATLPNINRFSKLFHCQNQEKICNDTITKDPTTPQVCRYTTFLNVAAFH